jgi:hypothetical protein
MRDQRFVDVAAGGYEHIEPDLVRVAVVIGAAVTYEASAWFVTTSELSCVRCRWVSRRPRRPGRSLARAVLDSPAGLLALPRTARCPRQGVIDGGFDHVELRGVRR